MSEQIPLQYVNRLTYKVVKSIVERTNRDLKVPVKFVEVYIVTITRKSLSRRLTRGDKHLFFISKDFLYFRNHLKQNPSIIGDPLLGKSDNS